MELVNSRIQRRTWDSEFGRGTVKSRHLAIAFRQSLFDDSSFVVLEPFCEAALLWAGAGPVGRKPSLLDAERVAITEDVDVPKRKITSAELC